MEEMTAWREFKQLLQVNHMTRQKLRPYHEALAEPMLSFIEREKEIIANAEPLKTLRTSETLHYFVTLGNGLTCFSFVEQKGARFLSHIEGVLVPLEQAEAPGPVLRNSLERKAIRQTLELETSNHLRMFQLLSHEKGTQAAREWFTDGDGYFLMARTWAPYLMPRKAFILYLCREQSNLTGNEATIERMDDDCAVVRFLPMYLDMYRTAGHLRQQISYEDYTGLFEAIWRDRAEKAGWRLEIGYGEETCVFSFQAMEEA
jgi:hypothetical protein